MLVRTFAARVWTMWLKYKIITNEIQTCKYCQTDKRMHFWWFDTIKQTTYTHSYILTYKHFMENNITFQYILHNTFYGCFIALLCWHLSPLHPGAHPEEQVPLSLSQISEFKQWQSYWHMSPNLPSRQSVQLTKENAILQNPD